MAVDTFLGVILHLIGGVAAGSFYVPFCKIRQWSWETYWLIFNLFAYLITPLIVACVMVPASFDVLAKSPHHIIFLVFMFGTTWGIGSIAFGLTIRYLGMGLGMSLPLGLCATFGTLIPPIFHGTFAKLLITFSGCTVLLGVAVCLAGIALCGYAGIRKERDLPNNQMTESVKEFALIKGFVMAAVAGLMSASMAFGIDAGKAIGEIAVDANIPYVHRNIPVLIMVMGGNFTSNLVFCIMLNLKNRSIRDYVTGMPRTLLRNYFFASLAGLLGYSEFFWYGMGTTKMGRYDFSSWSIHLAFVIITSSLWGIYLKEWKGVKPRTWFYIWGGILVLVLSTIVMGAGNYLAKQDFITGSSK